MLKHIHGAASLKDGEKLGVKMEGKEILVVRVNEKLYALNGKCTHLGCLLKKGRLENQIIICPCHGSSFDVTNGEVVKWIPNWPKMVGALTEKIGLARPLETYKVEILEQEVYVKI